MADVIIIEQESEGDSWKREEGWEQDLRRQLAMAFPGWPVVILPPGVMMSVEHFHDDGGKDDEGPDLDLDPDDEGEGEEELAVDS